jgi:hypothetical protein
MEWISFFEKQPYEGQQIFYYGEPIGVWAGRYNYSPNDPVSPHLIYCSEAFGVVDRMDAPWWMPNDGVMSRPNKPDQPYPKDYPNS